MKKGKPSSNSLNENPSFMNNDVLHLTSFEIPTNENLSMKLPRTA